MINSPVAVKESGETGATGFKAALTNTADDEQSINSLSWSVTSGQETKIFDVVTAAVTLVKSAVVEFALVVGGLFDENATAEIAKEYVKVADYSEAVETVTYVDEPFTYANQTIKSTGNEATDPVTLGAITYSSGYRKDGMNDYASISNNALYILATKYGSSNRGIAMTFTNDAAIPAVSALEEGAVLEMSFSAQVNASGDNGEFTITGFGNVDLTSTSTTLVRAILDPNTNKQYLILTDTSGNLISTKTEPLSASTFTGMSFLISTDNRYFTIDNLKVEKKAKDIGVITATVTDNGSGLEGATVAFGGYETVTDSNGIASAVLPNGTYTITASKSGYEHTLGNGDNHSKSVTVAGIDQSIDFTLSEMSYEKTPDTVVISGGQSFVAAPKTSTPNTTAAFTATVYDQYEIEIDNSNNAYTTTWEVYPSGTTTNDGIVTIDNNGVISVSQAFSVENSVKAYDVRANVVMNNAGLRSNYAVSTIYVGNMDVIYYEPIAWTTGADRTSSKSLTNAVTLPQLTTISLNMSFSALGTDGTSNRTLALVTNNGRTVVGLQYKKDGNTITAWTGWTGTNDMNQSDDIDKFNNKFVLVEGYTAGTPITVNFTIDKSSNTVTVSCGETTNSLPIGDLSTFTGLFTGMYRNTSTVSVNSVTVVEPDQNYLAISGSTGFAKVSGQTITRSYQLSQSVIVPGETFDWSVSPADGGVTVNDGVLAVSDNATAGKYTITATSSTNSEKTASIAVEIGGFQSFTANVTGPEAYNLGTDTTGTYAVTSLVDSYGDNVTSLFAPVWSSSNESVATIDSASGVLTVAGSGSTTITATIANGTKTTTVEVPVTVGAYYITKAAEGNTTAIDASAIVSNAAITGYQITTATSDGTLVSKTTSKTAPSSVDTTGADYVEVAPIYSYSGTLNSTGTKIAVPADTYDFDINATTTDRFDVYVSLRYTI